MYLASILSSNEINGVCYIHTINGLEKYNSNLIMYEKLKTGLNSFFFFGY